MRICRCSSSGRVGKTFDNLVDARRRALLSTKFSSSSICGRLSSSGKETCQITSWWAVEHGSVLSPDGFLEGADIVVVWYLYSKDVTGIIAENQAVELEN